MTDIDPPRVDRDPRRLSAAHDDDDPLVELGQLIGVDRRIDTDAENIQTTGKLSADALRQAYEHCAQRALDTAQANLERAREDQLAAEKFAEFVRKHGETLAQQMEAGFNRATKMVANFGSARREIETGNQ